MGRGVIRHSGWAGAALLLALLSTPLHAATSTIRSHFDGSEPQMPQRLLRDNTPTTCDAERFPGTFDTPAFYRTYEFCNPGPQTCFTVDFDNGTCDIDVHLEAYIDAFDPNDLATNYAGDLGATEDGEFSFVVPAGHSFLIVAQTNFGPATCQFGFTIDAMHCPAPAPALSPTGGALALGALAVIALLALRRTRVALAALALAATLGVFAGPAAAPLAAADPQPTAFQLCDLACGDDYQTCAVNQCGSGVSDQDIACLSDCRDAYVACRASCQ
jgi:hypothetical protein